MLTTCLACHEPFPANETVEHFPVGRRVAYDPRRGRLWAICPSCARWTLAPFEERWEALEELERLTSDRARLLAETENIGLLAAGDIEVVRVGRANLREESWWRFGQELGIRRKRAKRAILKGKIVDAAMLLLFTGIPFWGLSSPERWLGRARRKHFGREIWTAPLTECVRCGHTLETLRFTDHGRIDIRPHPEAPFALSVGCLRCAADGAHAEALLISGVPAEHVLRRTLAYRNFAGGTERTVREAVGLVESYPGPEQLLRSVSEERVSVAQLTQKGAFALEIALNTDVERRLLEMELAELEARWRLEEEIAAIADRL